MGHMSPGARESTPDRLLNDFPVVRVIAARAVIIDHVHRHLLQRWQQFPVQYLPDAGRIEEIGTDTLGIDPLFFPVMKQAPFTLGGTAVSDQYIHIMAADL